MLHTEIHYPTICKKPSACSTLEMYSVNYLPSSSGPKAYVSVPRMKHARTHTHAQKYI